MPEGYDFERMAKLHEMRAALSCKNSDTETTLTTKIEYNFEGTEYGTPLGKVAFQVGNKLQQEKVSTIERKKVSFSMTWHPCM